MHTPVRHKSLWSAKKGPRGAAKSQREELPPTFCLTCHAVCIRGHWEWNEARLHRLVGEGVTGVVCPAEKKIQLDLPEGIVTLLGIAKLSLDKQEKLRELIQRESQSALRQDPQDRLIRLTEKSDEWQIFTTQEHLASKLGNMIVRQFAGTINRDQRPEHNVVRIVWIAPSL